MKKIILPLLVIFILIFGQTAFCAQNDAPLSAAEIERKNPGFKQLAKGHGSLYLGAGTGVSEDVMGRKYGMSSFDSSAMFFIDDNSIHEVETDQSKYWVVNVHILYDHYGSVRESLIVYRINKKAPQYSVAAWIYDYPFSGWYEIYGNGLVPYYVYNYLTGKTPKAKEAKSSSSASSHSGGNTGKYVKYGAIIFAVIAVIGGAVALFIRRR